ncbi:MAG TPA: hypothetical protein VK679_20210, partial [Gemmatimonadaceae bacterium]|nr:hypothetical protein [Gemmatimonadaceae bacterium]
MPPLSSNRAAWCVACTLGIAPTPGLVGQPPRPAPPKSFTLPAKHDVTLPNGMRLTFVPYGAVPLATVSLIIRTGAIDESADQVWLSKLMGDYWL